MTFSIYYCKTFVDCLSKPTIDEISLSSLAMERRDIIKRINFQKLYHDNHYNLAIGDLTWYVNYEGLTANSYPRKVFATTSIIVIEYLKDLYKICMNDGKNILHYADKTFGRAYAISTLSKVGEN